MSWDIFVQDIPASASSVRDIPDGFRPRPLGTRSDVAQRIRETVPNVIFESASWASADGPGFSLEFNLGESTQVECLGIHVRGGDATPGLIADLLTRSRWRALDPQSETGLFDLSRAEESLRKWQSYRDSVMREQGPGGR